MSAKVMRYIGFSLYNWIEETVYRIWKTEVVSFCQSSKHPDTVHFSVYTFCLRTRYC